MKHWWQAIMDSKQKERVEALYGCDEKITFYMIHSGTKIGSTSKAKLDQGLVDELEDKD